MRPIVFIGSSLLPSWYVALIVALGVTMPVATQAAEGSGPPKLSQGAGKEAKASPAEKDDPAKFFLFYKGDISADQVRADLVYCIGQAKPILSFRDQAPNSGGLLGALINGRMAEIDRFRMRNAAMRKCMGLMGYQRYVVAQEFWRATVKNGDIVQDDKGLVDPEVVERMVAFAIGPVPATVRLQP
ncbi:MAG: hypothetical protein ACTHLU_14115 [Novosphingobium sp.]